MDDSMATGDASCDTRPPAPAHPWPVGSPTGGLRPPPRLALLGEARIVAEWAVLRLQLPSLRRCAPPGDGGPVLVVPGFGADDRWTESLRRFLGAIGYVVRGWGLGRNHGRVGELIGVLLPQVTAFAAAAQRPVRLVGWSLGGYLVRELARERPALVAQVVTLGAPVVGGPRYTATASFYTSRGHDLAAIEAAVAARESRPIEVPVDAIYSRTDGVVAWRACLDQSTPGVRHHEVRTSHLGLIAAPASFRLVARLLTRGG